MKYGVTYTYVMNSSHLKPGSMKSVPFSVEEVKSALLLTNIKIRISACIQNVLNLEAIRIEH